MEKGTRVQFCRAHDRANSLTGTVDSVQGDEILVLTEPDGVPVWANASDVTSLEVQGAKEEEKKEGEAQ